MHTLYRAHTAGLRPDVCQVRDAAGGRSGNSEEHAHQASGRDRASPSQGLGLDPSTPSSVRRSLLSLTRGTGSPTRAPAPGPAELRFRRGQAGGERVVVTPQAAQGLERRSGKREHASGSKRRK